MLAEMAGRCGGGFPIMIQSISEEGPISNIKDESDRSKGIRAMTKAKEGRS